MIVSGGGTKALKTGELIIREWSCSQCTEAVKAKVFIWLGRLSSFSHQKPSTFTTGSVTSWERWDAGLIPGLAQWIKDPELLPLRSRSQLQLGSNPWPGELHMPWSGQKRKKEKTECFHLWRKVWLWDCLGCKAFALWSPVSRVSPDEEAADAPAHPPECPHLRWKLTFCC